MSEAKSPMRRVFDKAERTVGGPLEDLVSSKSFTDALVKLHKLSRAVGGVVARAAGGGVETVLRTAHMPTQSDIQRLSRLLVELAGEVRALSPKIDEARAAAQRRRRKAPVAASRKAKRVKQPPRKGK